jgi:PncC family amidohydrolase
VTLKQQAKLVHLKFSKNNLTLALAESCTGGLISSTLTEIPGSSKYFFGSVVSYANRAKRDLLGLSEKVLRTEGAVSKVAASKMALGARKVFHSDWSVSVTGIAGPAGGTPLKPVGLVFIAVAGPKFVKVAKKNFKGSRKKIQRAAGCEALKLLLKNFR